MKKKIYFSLFFAFLIISIFTILIVKTTFENIKENFAHKYYTETLNAFNAFLNEESIFLKSIGQYLAQSDTTIQAYLTNNKKLLIKEYMPLYKSLYKYHLINEMHFFKTPVINFVAFSNLNILDINLSNSRRDILWVNTTLKPQVYFYICRHYPGLRVTYPIIHKYHIYGSISIGSYLTNFKEMFDKLNMPTTIYLNDNLLKKFLLPKRYKYYSKYPLYKKYRVIGKIYNIDLNKKYVVKGAFVYTIIPIKDLFKQTIGYLVVKRNFEDTLKVVKKTIIENIIFDILVFLIIFILFFIMFKYIYNRFEELQNILDNIKNQNFEKLPNKVKEKDEFDIFKNNLIDMAKELSLYINILTNEMNYYSKKAFNDELTSTYNRNFLEKKAEEITTKHKLTKEPLGVIIFDIDNFKQINDTYGHDIGDLVLSEVATTIKNILRKEDLFIRYGGEEFVILLQNTSFKNAIKIAEKIRKAVENLKIKTPKDYLKVTISVGVSEFAPEDKTIFDTIKRADIKLYEAKKNGKNKVFY